MPVVAFSTMSTMSHPHDAIDDLPPPLPEAAAAQPMALAVDSASSQALLEGVQQLQAGQAHQIDLIQKLHKTVLTSRSMINELVLSNNELKVELLKIKNTVQCDGCKKKDTAFAAQTMATLSVAGEGKCHECLMILYFCIFHLTPNSLYVFLPCCLSGQTPDEEIDNIIESRKRKQAWPVKHSTLNCFSVQQDLVKIRFHHSEKYQHIPVRIPKTEKNKGNEIMLHDSVFLGKIIITSILLAIFSSQMVQSHANSVPRARSAVRLPGCVPHARYHCAPVR